MTMFKNRPGLVLVAALLGALLSSCTSPETGEERFDVVEATIPEMQRAMEEGRLTSRALVEAHLLRIALYEERVNAAIAINANALTEADRLDQERAEGRVRGPLHGVPVALKDNVHTTHMPTTGGSLAFEGFVPPYEATLTEVPPVAVPLPMLDPEPSVDAHAPRGMGRSSRPLRLR